MNLGIENQIKINNSKLRLLRNQREKIFPKKMEKKLLYIVLIGGLGLNITVPATLVLGPSTPILFIPLYIVSVGSILTCAFLESHKMRQVKKVDDEIFVLMKANDSLKQKLNKEVDKDTLTNNLEFSKNQNTSSSQLESFELLQELRQEPIDDQIITDNSSSNVYYHKPLQKTRNSRN